MVCTILYSYLCLYHLILLPVSVPSSTPTCVCTCLLQLRIEARDGGTPPRSATALVSINVQRNLVRPVFQQSTYETTILETQSLGINILRVIATDADTKVSTSPC